MDGWWMDGLTVLLRQLDGVLRLFKIRARHHELPASDFEGALDDAGEVIVVDFSAVVHAAEYRVT